MSKIKSEMRIKTFVDSRPPVNGTYPVQHDVNDFCKKIDAVDIRLHLPQKENDPVVAVVVYNERW